MIRPALTLATIVALTACRTGTDPGERTPAETPDATASADGPKAVPRDCPEGTLPGAKCGTVRVFENRGSGEGRTIDLAYAIIPAANGNGTADPVFALAGGPGQAAAQLTPIAGANLKDVHETRDLVFVDQRGTGGSNGLQCLPEELGVLLEGVWNEDQAQLLADCQAKYDADLTQYGTWNAMDDLDDVRAALGYEEINLWGGSYGTRAALVYARRHPEHVRAMVLWGVAPPNDPFPATFAPSGQASLDALFDACTADAGCKKLVPDGAAVVTRIAERLRKQPAKVQVVDPRTNAPVEFELSADIFLGGVRLALYDASWAANLPAMMAAADGGNYQPLMSLLVPLTVAIASQIHFGMFLSVACSEDVARLTQSDLDLAAKTFLGEGVVSELQGACARWPASTVPAGYTDPVTSDVPTLLMAGAIDPVTPPSTAESAAATLSKSKVVPFPNVGHGTSNAAACEASLTAAFFDRPDPDAVDASCTKDLKRPPFAGTQ